MAAVFVTSGDASSILGTGVDASAIADGYVLTYDQDTGHLIYAPAATNVDLTPYLLAATAAATYQTISGMSAFLTTSAASSTYQTLSGMSSYLTTSSAASTYATITNLALKAPINDTTLTGNTVIPNLYTTTISEFYGTSFKVRENTTPGDSSLPSAALSRSSLVFNDADLTSSQLILARSNIGGTSGIIQATDVTGDIFKVNGLGSVWTKLAYTSSQTDLTTTAADGAILENTTAATSGVTVQMSPRIRLRGSARKTTAVAFSSFADWTIQNLPASGGSAITSTLQFSSSINGGAYAVRASLTSAGVFDATTLSQGGSTLATILGSYLTTASAASTYQTIAGMSSYLTTSSAASTYVPLTRTVSTTAPLTGGGALSSDLTLAVSASSGSAAGTMSSTHYSLVNGATSSGTANTLVLRDGSGGATFGSSVTISGPAGPVSTIYTFDDSPIGDTLFANFGSVLTITKSFSGGSGFHRITVAGTAFATLFSGSGASLTTLNGTNISSGTVAAARLGSGSPTANTVLLGDNSWSGTPTLSTLTSSKTGLGTTAADGLMILNTTAAVSSGATVQMSPRLRLRGSAWESDNSVSRTLDFTLQALPATGFVTTGTLQFQYSNSSTGTYSTLASLTSAGLFTATTFSGSGASLTTLNGSNISSGTVAAARLGSGTASANTVLLGNNTWSGTPALSKLTLTADDTYAQWTSGQIQIIGSTNTNKRLMIGVETTASTMYSYLQSVELGGATRPLILQPSGGAVGIGPLPPSIAQAVFNVTKDATYTDPTTWAYNIVNATNTSKLLGFGYDASLGGGNGAGFMQGWYAASTANIPLYINPNDGDVYIGKDGSAQKLVVHGTTTATKYIGESCKVGLSVSSAAIVTTGAKTPGTFFEADCTISGWSICSDVSTTATVAIYVNGSIVSASAPVSLSAATSATSSTLTGWTTTISKGDVVTINVTANNNASAISVVLYGTKR